MESIKHKMDTMVKEKDAAIEKAMGFEAETEELNKVRYYWIEKTWPHSQTINALLNSPVQYAYIIHLTQ